MFLISSLQELQSNRSEYSRITKSTMGASLNSPATSTVFIVDDDEAVRDSLTVLLTSEGWRVEVFGNGTDFLQTDRQAAGNCLLLDLNMPLVSGQQVIETLNSRGDPIPVIVITSQNDAHVVAGLRDLGVAEVIAKPIDPSLLFGALNRIG